MIKSLELCLCIIMPRLVLADPSMHNLLRYYNQPDLLPCGTMGNSSTPEGTILQQLQYFCHAVQTDLGSENKLRLTSAVIWHHNSDCA